MKENNFTISSEVKCKNGSKLKRSIGGEKQHIEAFSDIDYDLII